MTTEIIGFIIIIGAVIALLARHHLNKAEDDPEVLEAATGRLRYELEQAADEIISRMTEHVDQLEKMLREADYKAQLLQEKIDRLEALQAAAQPAAAPVIKANPQSQQYRQAEEKVQPFEIFRQPQQEHAKAAAMEMSTSDEKAWDLIREASMKLEAQYEAQSNTMQAVQQADSLQQAVDIQTGNIDNLVSGSSYTPVVDENVQKPLANTSKITVDAEQGLDTEAATRQAREMLAQGYQVEEIAQATGLGIGAVHLIRQLQGRR